MYQASNGEKGIRPHMYGKLPMGKTNVTPLPCDGYFSYEFDSPVALGDPQGPPLVTS